MFATIQIDLTKIANLYKAKPELLKNVQFQDGVHQLFNFTIGDRREPDKYGNNLLISCKPKDEQKDSKWYIGQGKLWAENNVSAPQQNTSASIEPSATESSPLPF